jgi:lysophospholipase L1-like esterase
MVDGKLGHLWQDIQSINQHLESYVQQLENVHFFNATGLFLLNDSNIDTKLMPDLVHPSALGSRIWGSEIVKTVMQIINN